MSELEKRYSTNDEDFGLDDFGDLMSDMEDDGSLAVGAIYYEADFRRMTAKDIVSVDRLMEDMEEALFDECGECAHAGLEASKEALAELEAFLLQWVEKHTDVTSYYKIVGETRPMQITEADLTDNC